MEVNIRTKQGQQALFRAFRPVFSTPVGSGQDIEDKGGGGAWESNPPNLPSGKSHWI
jgi:hypothetical protein